MRASVTVQRQAIGLCLIAVSVFIGGCNTTKARVDTTINFFSSTTPNDLLSADGMVLKEQKINLFAGVTYENLRQEAAAGSGQCMSALASLYGISPDKQAEFGLVLQRKHADLTVHLKLVSALNGELARASLLP